MIFFCEFKVASQKKFIIKMFKETNPTLYLLLNLSFYRL